MSVKKPELHIFSDSSSKAYACAAYFRVVENNKAKVSFVIGKSRLHLKKNACQSQNWNYRQQLLQLEQKQSY